MSRFTLVSAAGCLAIAVVWATASHVQALGRQPQPAETRIAESRAVIDRYCVTCHNQKAKAGGLTLDTLDVTQVGEKAETWEKVVRKLRGGMMPPAGRPRPDRVAYDGFRLWLESELDRAAAAR